MMTINFFRLPISHTSHGDVVVCEQCHRRGIATDKGIWHKAIVTGYRGGAVRFRVTEVCESKKRAA